MGPLFKMGMTGREAGGCVTAEVEARERAVPGQHGADVFPKPLCTHLGLPLCVQSCPHWQGSCLCRILCSVITALIYLQSFGGAI